MEEISLAGLPVVGPTETDREVLRPSHNVAPQQQVATVVPGGADTDTVRVRAMRWGLVPSWARDPSIGNRMINARVETVGEKPAFRSLIGTRRCVLPADGWYEWQVVPPERSGTGKSRKQPFFMSMLDGSLVGLAGLYSWWRDPDVADTDDPAAWLGTVTVLTTDAEPTLRAVHDRMPAVLPGGDWATWLDREVDAPTALDLLSSVPHGRFRAAPVSAAVGNVRNDYAGLRDRPTDADLAGAVDPSTGQLFG